MARLSRKGKGPRPHKDWKLHESTQAPAPFTLVEIRLPVALTFAALVGGLVAGIAAGRLGAPSLAGAHCR